MSTALFVMRQLTANLAAEVARLSEDVDAAAAGKCGREVLEDDVTALSRLVRAMKKLLGE